MQSYYGCSRKKYVAVRSYKSDLNLSQQTLYTYWDSNSSLDASRSVDVNKHWLNTRAFLTNKNPNGCAKISVH